MALNVVATILTALFSAGGIFIALLFIAWSDPGSQMPERAKVLNYLAIAGFDLAFVVGTYFVWTDQLWYGLAAPPIVTLIVLIIAAIAMRGASNA
ncbi:MAG TPA: hypothetical protein DCL54_02715 [Alphaproteobacteria bacterium]|nr:hypothetical protein [Alphaproteobacteria bacterium]HAJ45476.1 hypothetical protein [Alphaproteobacteria bacterium]